LQVASLSFVLEQFCNHHICRLPLHHSLNLIFSVSASV
jgi:hypothetical protein